MLGDRLKPVEWQVPNSSHETEQSFWSGDEIADGKSCLVLSDCSYSDILDGKTSIGVNQAALQRFT